MVEFVLRYYDKFACEVRNSYSKCMCMNKLGGDVKKVPPPNEPFYLYV